MSEWISVDNELPKRGVDVIVFSIKYKKQMIAWLTDDDTWIREIHLMQSSSVTHWMPLPQPPKEGE